MIKEDKKYREALLAAGFTSVSELAKKTTLSLMTVYRALNGKSVSLTTQKIIIEALKKGNKK